MFVFQDGREQYELAATSEQGGKKKGTGKKKEKDMDELKKEVDMVSMSTLSTWSFCYLMTMEEIVILCKIKSENEKLIITLLVGNSYLYYLFFNI